LPGTLPPGAGPSAEASRRAVTNYPGTVTNLISATEAAQEAERARQEAAAVPRRAESRGALGGRTRNLRLTWHAEVVDVDLVYHHYRDHPEVQALLYRLANEAASSGVRNPALLFDPKIVSPDQRLSSLLSAYPLVSAYISHVALPHLSALSEKLHTQIGRLNDEETTLIKREVLIKRWRELGGVKQEAQPQRLQKASRAAKL
jgi:hypothetical protein